MQLEYTGHRHLSSEPGQAERSVLGFLNQLIERFGIATAVLLQASPATRAGGMEAASLIQLRSRSISLSGATHKDLLAAYAVTPLRTTQQLRTVVTAIWPALHERVHSGVVTDAVAVGLYGQVERFIREAQSES